MSYFLRVLCRSSERVRRSDIVEFILDGVYFDAPRFAPPKGDTGLDDPDWKELEVHYEENKRPIIFTETISTTRP